MNAKFLYLGMTKDGKQVGLFTSSDSAFMVEKVHTAVILQLHEKTGQYYETNGSIGRLELLPKRQDV